MKAAIYNKNLMVEIVDLPKPQIQDNKGAIINILGCGLCGSDIVKYQRNLIEEGTVLGHEVVGIIEEIGCKSQTDLKVGDKVAVAHHVPCYKCRYCEQKSYSMCKQFKKSYFVPGGFADYMYISDAHLTNNTVKVPESLSNLEATAMEPIGCVLRALDIAKLGPDQNVLVIGLGYIGLLFVQALKAKNYKVLGCDLIDERIELAKKFGADLAFKSDDLIIARSQINNFIDFEGVDVVVLASGSTASVKLALQSVRDGGKILVFASIPDDKFGFFNNEIYYRELTVCGGYSSSPEFLPEAINLLSCGKIKVSELYKVMKIEDLKLAVDETLSHSAMKVYFEL